MGETTGISWTDATWNPIRGCSMAKGSETGGCLNCYAARMAARNLPGHKSPITGEPFAIMRDSGPRWTGRVELIESQLKLPLHWRKERKIFVNSMSDLFHEKLSFELIDLVFAVMALCQQHTFQALTKRADRMEQYLRSRSQSVGFWEAAARKIGYTFKFTAMDGREYGLCKFPLPNIWLGVSVENQATADKRIPHLLRTPAAVRFVSYEPALGPLNLDSEEIDGLHALGCGDSTCSTRDVLPGCRGIDWLICGGESGPGARPMDEEWARPIKNQCAAAGVAFYMKQLCEKGKPIPFEQFPVDLQIRQFPEAS